MSERQCFEGTVSEPITWLQNKEVIFYLTHPGGKVKTWLNGSLADPSGIRPGFRIRVFGELAGNLLRGNSALFYQSKHKMNNYHNIKQKVTKTEK